ncbi:hypothetical protein PORY_001129 [Pneumocystis oryctolagi]|uniref:Uncharacterized protein n=1 Tax=Pneumocystis oryctolagi TaxID=42067 RepID=A0ACB7CF59_9ASCO|nr:hypothetical protein PORY_001129 [Pneumocystis oryctolagi]
MTLIENIQQRLLLFLAQNIGRWSMTYKLYTRPNKHFYITSLSYHPGILFCKTQQISVEMDGDFEQMITKTKLWNMRQIVQLEGDVYEINDFIVRIGSTDKGVIINIEYMACDDITQGQITIQNFLTEYLIPTFKNVCIRLSYNETVLNDKKSYERSMLDYGTKKQRLESDSFRQFDACHLCMSQTCDTVSCDENGDIFCRVCIMENLLSQHKEIKKMEEEKGKKKRLDEIEEKRIEKIVRKRAIEDFEAQQMVASLNYDKSECDNNVFQKKEVKEVFELDKEELLKIAKNDRDREKMKYMKEQEIRSIPKMNSFWIPSLTPSINSKEPLKKQKFVPICPASDPNKSHRISLKSLISVHFTENNSSESKTPQRICPACKKKLSNIYGAYLMKSCGHVICTNCLNQFVRDSGVCYVCEISLYSEKTNTTKDPSKLLIVELSKEGTGFSAKKNAIAEKFDVAFQGS